MRGERAQMLKNLEASLVQLEYVAADLSQEWASEPNGHEVHALRQKVHAARCALEIAIEIFNDFERAQEAREANDGIHPQRRSKGVFLK